MVRLALLILFILTVLPFRAEAGQTELSVGFNFSKSSYSDSNYSWNRRWGASAGYHFTETSEIELGFQDVTDQNHIVGYDETMYHDRIYSLNWVQDLLPRSSFIVPYFKAGIGQLNREVTGSYGGVVLPNTVVDSVTAVLGGGVRLFLSQNFAIRTELTSYLTGGKISTYKDNFAFTFGVSCVF